jgi:nicotinamidase-related amidase
MLSITSSFRMAIKPYVRHYQPRPSSLLKKRAQAAGMSAIYVSDNFGQWRSDVSKLLAYCVRPEAIGRPFVEQIQPDTNDYFVLKPTHFGFYQTPLEVLLRCWGASTLVLRGLTTNN